MLSLIKSRSTFVAKKLNYYIMLFSLLLFMLSLRNRGAFVAKIYKLLLDIMLLS